ncbi:hypothetical protein [Methylobacterium sp. CM6247]
MDQMTQKLLEALRDAVQVHSDAADEFAFMAEVADREGLETHATAIRLLVRGHRIKVLELEGRLAAIMAEHGRI